MSNLKTENFKEAMAAMDRALMPRTEEGLIEPIEFPMTHHRKCFILILKGMLMV